MQLIAPDVCNKSVVQILTLGEADLLENRIKSAPDSSRVAQVVDKRADTEINHFAVIGQIIDRYSFMTTSALESMGGMFSFSEFLLMANANPSNYWEDIDIASILVDSHGGIEAISQASHGKIMDLADKLCRLSVTQRIALVDVLERIYRGGPKGKPEDDFTFDLEESIQAFGLVLK